MKRLLGALALGLFAAGCAYQQRGHPFDSETVAQLQPGVSTEQDATGKLGSPTDAFNYEAGRKLLTWAYVYRVPIGTSSEARAAILFDADGKMIHVVNSSQQRVTLWWNP